MAYNQTTQPQAHGGGYDAHAGQQPHQPVTKQSYYENRRSDDWNRGSSKLDIYQFRLTVLLTIVFVYSFFNLIPYAITSSNTFTRNSDNAWFNLKLAGFCVIFIGSVIPFLRYFFSVNASTNNDILNKICGFLIAIGGCLLLIGNIMFINDATENINASLCESEDYVCCSCYYLSYLCVFGSFSVVAIGADLLNDFGSTQTTRMLVFCLIFIFGVIFILVQFFNHEGFSSIQEATIVGWFCILLFGCLAIASAYKGSGAMSKYVGIAFGCSVLLTLYFTSISMHTDNVHVMYLGMSGFIVYDLVN